MVFDPLSLAFGLLGGGGSTSQQTTVTTNQTVNNAFNPQNAINIGGGVTGAPNGNAQGSPSVTSNPSTTQTQPSNSPLPFLGGLGASAGGVSLPTGLAPLPAQSSISNAGFGGGLLDGDNGILLLGAAAVAAFAFL